MNKAKKDKQEKNNKYTCPMHPKVVSDKLGECPKCGMDLVLEEEAGHPGDKSAHMIHEANKATEKLTEDYYTCPMHPEIQQDSPGKCPECGMDLVKKSDIDSGHAKHDHASMMATPQAAQEFLRRFYIVSVLLVPLVLFSEMVGVRFLGVPDFPFRHYIEFGIASIIFYYSLVFFEHAKHEIKAKQYGMMTLVSIAVGAGYLFSAASTFIPAITQEFYLEITTLIWILLFGHFLEAKSSTAAGDALQEVAKLLPGEAHLVLDGDVKDIPVARLKEGDLVLVKPGEKVPADGIIVEGFSHFNEAHLTGESVPVEKGKDERAVAGAIAEDGAVRIKLDRVGENSTIGQIQKLVSEAQQTKPSAQKLADRAAKWLTFSALTVAILTLLVWSFIVGEAFVFSITLAITVLVIACPHALGLAIPTVSTIATRLAVNNGLFIKDMGKLEVVKGIDYVIFDKTGTLTKGEFGVTDIKVSQNSKVKTLEELLEIAASLEEQSSHVIGMAVVNKAKEMKLKLKKVSNFKNYAGKGIGGTIDRTDYFIGNKTFIEEKSKIDSAIMESFEELLNEGKTVIFLADNKQILGVIALADKIKDESKQAVEELHKLGVKVAMLTGDNQQAAEGVAKQLNIDTVFAEVLPENKYEYVRKLQKEGNKVIMAGDGVNDAPALTQADVGVAIGAGTDVAVEAGDIVLTQSNPQHIVRLVVLSRKVYRKMLQNLFWAVGYNVIAIPAAAGLFIPIGLRLTPGVGAFIMSLSSVIVVANAMTLRKTELSVNS